MTYDQAVVDTALAMVREALTKPGELMDSKEIAKRVALLELARSEFEQFGVFFLDNRHRLIEFE